MNDNPNNARVFDCFEKEGQMERYKYHFKLSDLTRDNFYGIGVPDIEE